MTEIFTETNSKTNPKTKSLLAGAVLLLSVGFAMEQLGSGQLLALSTPPILPVATRPITEVMPGATSTTACQTQISESQGNPKSKLSRATFAKLITVPEGKSRSAIRQIVATPYCQMPSLAIRAGTTSEREAYPLDFDRRTWLVLLYEGESYAGYDLMVQ
jgi:hypothetical protein